MKKLDSSRHKLKKRFIDNENQIKDKGYLKNDSSSLEKSTENTMNVTILSMSDQSDIEMEAYNRKAAHFPYSGAVVMNSIYDERPFKKDDYAIEKDLINQPDNSTESDMPKFNRWLVLIVGCVLLIFVILLIVYFKRRLNGV